MCEITILNCLISHVFNKCHILSYFITFASYLLCFFNFLLNFSKKKNIFLEMLEFLLDFRGIFHETTY